MIRLKKRLLGDSISRKSQNKVRVMVTAAWKAEEINLVCEILKLNFQRPVEIHLFSNASKEMFEKMQPVLEWDLIDALHLWSEENANPSKGGSTGRRTTEQKRERSIRFTRQWARVLRTIGGIGGHWIILECDHIPLYEESFYGPYDRLGEYDIICNLFDLKKSHPELLKDSELRVILEKWKKLAADKISKGFFEPGSLYLRSEYAYWFGRKLDELNEPMAKQGLVAESVMAYAINSLKPKRSNYSTFLMHDQLTQIDPINSVIHSHCILNLSSWFRVMGICKGAWVNKVLSRQPFVRCADGTEIVLEGKPVLGTLDLNMLGGSGKALLLPRHLEKICLDSKDATAEVCS